jgi:hypothetical protein
MTSTRYVRYQGSVYSVINEFLSGNGTYDMRMLMLVDKNKEVFVVPEIDVQEFSPEIPGRL